MALALALSLSACSSSPTAASHSEAEPAIGRFMESRNSASAQDAEAAAPMAADTAKEAGLEATIHSVKQSVIKTGTARLVADNPEETFATMSADVIGLGGSIQASSINPLDSGPSVWATLRIPSAKYDAFVGTLATYGSLKEISTSTEDVGAAIADLDARTQALESSIARLRELMNKAESTADLLEAESQMTSRQAELDGIKAQRTWYADQVEMSTLDVTITSPLSFRSEPGSVWEQSWQGFVDGVTTIVVGIVWLLPWAILLALILTPLLIWRGRRRRAKLARSAQSEGITTTEVQPQHTPAPSENP